MSLECQPINGVSIPHPLLPSLKEHGGKGNGKIATARDQGRLVNTTGLLYPVTGSTGLSEDQASKQPSMVGEGLGRPQLLAEELLTDS